MSQETRVYEMPAHSLQELEKALKRSLPQGAEWRAAPHARFAVKVEGVVLTAYESGKTVLQGKALDEFIEQHLGGVEGFAASAAMVAKGRELEAIDAPTIGSDESGKGDYFGPLVVAGVFTTPDDMAFLREIGAADSKLLTDVRMMGQAGRIEKRLDHEVRRLMPAEYNERIEATGNANHVLAGLHAEVLGALHSRHQEARRTVVDRFSSAPVLERAITARGFTAPGLDLRPGAESHPAVAAASILARVHFLDGLKHCAEECATDLPKGAGTPVDEAARRVVEIGGMVLLGKVAKVHFKNTTKIPRLTR